MNKASSAQGISMAEMNVRYCPDRISGSNIVIKAIRPSVASESDLNVPEGRDVTREYRCDPALESRYEFKASGKNTRNTFLLTCGV